MRLATTALLVAGLLAVAPARASANGRVGGQYRYWTFSGGNDLRNPLVYWAAKRFHVQLEHWDFVDPATSDQFRPEVGIHLRDRRKGVYTLQWRHERRQERFWLGTDQILGGHVVGRAQASPIVSADTTLWVAGLGADYYWKSWNFLSLDVIRDPRLDGLWVVPVRLRLANEANDWLQVAVAPASRNSIGWALEAKKRWVRAGVERNNRFDFTQLDNTIVTVGFEFSLAPRE